MGDRPQTSWMAGCFAATILISAFLVFQVQPIISKTILPWFGGSPAVWTTCMLFFQVALFGGYVYAHLLTRLVPRWQGVIHFLLLVVSLSVLPILPDASWKPTGAEDPTLRIVGLLLLTVGLPYFLLAATGPLVQAWFSQTCAQRSPYRLYALSNAGSLAALLSYPFLVEPALATDAQGRWWSVGFCAFVLACGYCAVRIGQLGNARPNGDREAVTAAHSESIRLGWGVRLAWLLWPAFASVMLLATTNHVCQDVAVIPFLWVLPLSLYLLTFVLTFDSERWYSRRVCALGALCSILALTVINMTGYIPHIFVEVATYFSALLFVCMICHGELVASKPSPQYLTQFYLMCSGGGALGGVLVAIVCPLMFSNYFEMNLAFLVGYILALGLLFYPGHGSSPVNPRLKTATGICGFIGLLVVVQGQIGAAPVGYLATTRSFYGVLSVVENKDESPELRGRALVHGRIVHGFQYSSEERRRETTKYYASNTGVGLTLRQFPRNQSLRVGVIGLGVGTVAAYGREGDYFRFYEINPDVNELAHDHFTFLKDSRARCEIILGDARLMMEREEPQRFDVLILDAFSGDAIPTHLLTREAFANYSRHLKPSGVLTANISNRHVDLRGVFVRLADHYQLETAEFLSEGSGQPGSSAAHWLSATTNREYLNNPIVRAASSTVEKQTAQLPMWTDQYSNLLWILK